MAKRTPKRRGRRTKPAHVGGGERVDPGGPGAVSPAIIPPSGAAEGLECKSCGCRHFLVVYTRPLPKGGIRRRRECRYCGRRITTHERPAESGPDLGPAQ